jgi:DNA (cytosine-5)-methyltransferase 1
MKILNLYAGIGGNRKLWSDEHEITAIEYDQATADVYKAYFPNDTVIVADAHQYLLDHYKEFDFIWSSPPCPSHSEIRRCGTYRGQQPAIYPEMDLYQQIILLQAYALKGTKWLIENVNPYYTPLIAPTKKLHRHFYWANFPIGHFEVNDERTHLAIKASSEVYGFTVKGTEIKNKVKALRNMVDPELGDHILDCAMGVMRKQNVNQLSLL